MTVICACESTDDWTPANGAVSLDEADFKEGAASVLTTGLESDHDYIDNVYDPAGVWNWSAYDHLTFWFKASERTEIRFRVYSGANIGIDYIEWTRQFLQQVPVVDTWYRVKLYKDDYDADNGAINWAAVKALRIRVYQTGTGETYHIDDIRIETADPIKAKIGAAANLDYVSDDVLEADIWGDDLKVGRWQLLLKNIDNKYGGRFHSNEASDIEINAVTMMKGYVDDAFPFLDERGYYTNKLKVIGRDYGRDLARLMYTGKYTLDKGDDIIDAILAAKGSEITYNSPHTAGIVPIDRSRTYLIDWLQDIAAALNFSAYVDQAKALKFFAIGDESSGIALKSVALATDNNILHLLKGEEIGFSIANSIELSAGSLIDHWTDGNKVDFTLGAGTAIDHETTLVVVGTNSIKFSNVAPGKPAITLDFTGGRYSHAALDLSEGDEMSFYIRHDNAGETVQIKVFLEDDTGKEILFERSDEAKNVSQKGYTWPLDEDKWHKIQIQIGDNITPRPFGAAGTNDKWRDTGDPGFDWENVLKITFQGVQILLGAEENISPTNFYLDRMAIPTVEVISLVSDATSDDKYGTSEWFDRREDVKTQIELDILSGKSDPNQGELAKRKNPIKNIRIIATGQTGIKYPGQTVTVQAPKHGLADATTYRIVSYHHQYRKDPIKMGHSFITTLDLIKDDLSPATQFIDPRRYMLNKDPVGATLEIMALTRRRVRTSKSTQRKQFGDTHPVITLLLSGSGTTFPVDPDDGNTWILTADIAGPPVYYGDEGVDYVYDLDAGIWIRGPMLLRRAAQPPAGGEIHGDQWVDTDAGVSGITYQWDSVLSDWIHVGQPTITDASDFEEVEWPTDQLAIEMRPWTGNFSLVWDDRNDDPPTDWNHFKWGQRDNENAADATIQYAGTPPTTMDINFGQNLNVADGEWYVYWDENFITGEDYDVKWSQNYSDASGAGKGLLAVVEVRNGAPVNQKSPSVMLYNTYTPAAGFGSIVAHSITSKHISADWFTGKNYRTAVDVGEIGGPAGIRFNSAAFTAYSGGTQKTIELLSASGKISVYGSGMFLVRKDDGTIVGTIGGTVVGADCIQMLASLGKDVHIEAGGSGFHIPNAGDPEVRGGNLDPDGDHTRGLGAPGDTWRYYAPRTNLAGRPAPAAGVVGMLWCTREGAGTKEFFWICVQNDANTWEWIQIGVST